MSRCIVSMAINAQPARSIDEDVLCVYSINIWSKSTNSRRSPLCLSDSDEFTKEGSRRSPPVPNSQYGVAQQLFSGFLNLMICFVLLIFNSFLLGGIVDKFDN